VKDFLFVINPNANTRKLEKTYPTLLSMAKKILGSTPDYVLTKGRMDAYYIAKDNIGNYDAIVACGGDGTANEVANALIGKKTALGLIPAGSANDHHKTHGIPFNWPQSLMVLKQGFVVHSSVGYGEGDTKRYFLEMADAGFSGFIAKAAHKEAKWLKGEPKYNYLILKYLFKFRNIKTKVILDEKRSSPFFPMSNIGISLTNQIVGFPVLPGNNPFKRDFGIFIAYGMSPISLVNALLHTFDGSHLKMPGIIVERAKRVEVETEEGIPWELEGEIFSQYSTKLKFVHVPKSLWVVASYPFYKNRLERENIEYEWREKELKTLV